jgi:two-component system sensor histidine kinase ChvG
MVDAGAGGPRPAAAGPTVHETRVSFLVADPARQLQAVRLHQELWRPRDGPPFRRLPAGDAWALELPRPPVDRMEYQLELRRAGARPQVVCDPANPRRAAGPFGEQNAMPELREVAEEFDRMVTVLHNSADDIRRAAEDNAHAFKTPIAVIRQSLEPLRRVVSADNQRLRRAIERVDHSLDRLDGLVASARRLDEATADLVAEPRRPVDLQRLLGKLIESRAVLLPGREIRLRGELSPAVYVLGSESIIETIIENLIDNAASFAPPGSEILVRLRQERDIAHIEVLDEGPGVPPAQLDQIFERYFSARRKGAQSDAGPGSFGIGLSIARRNVEAMRGMIEASTTRNPSRPCTLPY